MAEQGMNELMAELARLQGENEALKARVNKPRKLSCKVSDKGGVSVYGLNVKFPVTLYLEQWEKLIEFMPEVKTFIEANRSKLTTKEQSIAKKAGTV